MRRDGRCGRSSSPSHLLHLDSPGVAMAASERFSLFDRLTTLWIFLAMALGVGLGALVPGLPVRLDAISWGGVSLPLAIGLIWMMYPPLRRVRYGGLPRLLTNRPPLGVPPVR